MVRRLGGPEVFCLEESARLEPAKGEVLVRMTAAGVNPADLLLASGKYLTETRLPYEPGIEGSGVVEAVGAGVAIRPGERVMLKVDRHSSHGTWRDHIVVSYSDLVRMPAALSDVDAAAAFVAGLTSWVGLVRRARLHAGQSLLLTAADSTVALAAVQIARSLGAMTIGVVRSAAAREAVLDAGYDLVLCADGSGLAESVVEASGGGVDVAFDCVGGDTTDRCLRALVPGGRLVVYGAAAPGAIRLGLRALISKEPKITAFLLSNWLSQSRRHDKESAYQSIVELLESRTLRPRISRTFPLKEVQRAVAYAMRPSRPGRVVLTIGARAT